MNTILHLQRFTPTISAANFDVALASSVSNVCPTMLAGDQFPQFELD
jgi:hypothetical protein